MTRLVIESALIGKSGIALFSTERPLAQLVASEHGWFFEDELEAMNEYPVIEAMTDDEFEEFTDCDPWTRRDKAALADCLDWL